MIVWKIYENQQSPHYLVVSVQELLQMEHKYWNSQNNLSQKLKD